MTIQTAAEIWPAWAKAPFIALVVLAIIVTLPWVLTWTTMGASCVPMMDGMRNMMAPGMMR